MSYVCTQRSPFHPPVQGCSRVQGAWYLSVLSRQIGVAEWRLRVHRLVVHVSQGWDKDKVGAGATLTRHKHRGGNEHS